MTTVVEESSVPSPPATATVVEEEQMVEETAARQTALTLSVGVGSGGEDVVMVAADNGGLAPSLSARGHDVATSVTLESSAAVTC
jgi:hypothetical protein